MRNKKIEMGTKGKWKRDEERQESEREMFGDEKDKHGDERIMGIDKERHEIKRIGERLLRAREKGKWNNIGQMKNNLGNLKRIVVASPQCS